MKAIVTENEVLNELKKKFGNSEFTKEQAFLVVKELYYRKTGIPCSQNTAKDKIVNLIMLGRLEKKPLDMLKIVNEAKK